jgi:drug/metabolite transporter (DMT)-like permease
MFRSSSNHHAVVALILAAASWGVGTAVSKRAVAEIPPLALLPMQLAASVALLSAFRLLRRPDRGLPSAAEQPTPGTAALTRLGILNPGLAYAFSLVGLVYLSASLSVLLWALEPIAILFLARRFLGERIGIGIAALSAVAVAGMALVAYDPDATGRVLGVALTIAGVACCAIYTILARQWIGTADSTIDVVVGQQVYALALVTGLAAAAWLVAGVPGLPAVSGAGWMSAIASGVLYYGAAYSLYLIGLRRVPAAQAAVSFYLIPVFGVAAGVAFLGDTFQPSQWLAVGLVLAAVAGIAVRIITGPIEASDSLATAVVDT